MIFPLRKEHTIWEKNFSPSLTRWKETCTLQGSCYHTKNAMERRKHPCTFPSKREGQRARASSHTIHILIRTEEILVKGDDSPTPRGKGQKPLPTGNGENLQFYGQ